MARETCGGRAAAGRDRGGSGDSLPGGQPLSGSAASRGAYGLEDLHATCPDSGHWVPFGAVQPTAEEKVHERRLRRAALRKGLHLTKSCKLDPDHPEFGRWWVVTTPANYPDVWRSLGQVLTPRDRITLEAAAFVEATDLTDHLVTVNTREGGQGQPVRHGHRGRSVSRQSPVHRGEPPL